MMQNSLSAAQAIFQLLDDIHKVVQTNSGTDSGLSQGTEAIEQDSWLATSGDAPNGPETGRLLPRAPSAP